MTPTSLRATSLSALDHISGALQLIAVASEQWQLFGGKELDHFNNFR
jgi:hypothetical protein